MNNVVTSTLVFEGDVQVNEYVGGYDDWLYYSTEKAQSESRVAKTVVVEQKSASQDGKQGHSKKLSYKDQRELDALPAQIESFEEEVETLQKLMADNEFYKQEKDEIQKIQQQLIEAEASLSHCYTRWEELE